MTPQTPDPARSSIDPDRTGLELEAILRHIIAVAQHGSAEAGHDELLGAGIQLVYANSGIKLMSIKSDLDPRNHELLSAGALVRASSAAAPAELFELLVKIDQLINQAAARCYAATVAGATKN